MKKNTHISIICFVLLVSINFASCTNYLDDRCIEPTASKRLGDIDLLATLNVKSQNELLGLLDEESGIKKSSLGIDSEDYIGLTERVVNVDRSILEGLDNLEDYGPIEEITFYDILGYEDLVPNEKLAKLLNTRGEIVVEGTLYRITEHGTFYTQLSNQKGIDVVLRSSLAREDLSIPGTRIDENTIQVADGIYLYETFKELVPEITDSTTFYYPELDNYEVSDGGKSRQSNNFGIPNADRFPRFKSGAKTCVGKALSGLFGDNSYKKVKLSSKRRLKVKLYSYSYYFYHEIGAVAKMKKKNWIGWSGTKADELVLGWRNVILELKIDAPAQPQARPAIGGVSYQNIPGMNQKGWVVNVFGMDLTPALKAAAKAGTVALKNHLKTESTNSNALNVNPDAVVVWAPNKAYTIILDQHSRSYRTGSLRKVFASGLKIIISIDLHNLPSSWTQWARTVEPTIKEATVTKLIQGEVLIAGRLGSTWGGMGIYKN